MDDFTWSEVGQRLRDWRIAAQLSQRALAEQGGLSQPAIQAIEAGTCNPQLSSLQQLAAALGRTTRELVCGQFLGTDEHVQRLERIVCSGNILAIAAADQGLRCADALLEPPVLLRRPLVSTANGPSRGRRFYRNEKAARCGSCGQILTPRLARTALRRLEQLQRANSLETEGQLK